MIENRKCNAANWCASLATPNTSFCRLHVKFPLLHSFETQAQWLNRVTRELNAAKRRAEKEAKEAKKEARR